MLRFQLINNIKTALTTDNLIIWTNLFNAGTHFHADHCSFAAMTHCFSGLLTLAVRNSTLRKIVRRQFYGNAVAGYDADEVLSHLTGHMSYNLVAILEFYPKLGSRQSLYNRTGELDNFLVGRHKYN